MSRANELMKHTPAQFIRHIVALPPEYPIRLYSYQGEEAWSHAEKVGHWSGNSQHIEGDDHDWARPYQWMRDRMAERVPSFSGDYPMWGWIKRPSTKPKPRRYRGTSEKIRLTVVVPRSRVLFSDYDTWHSVLNHGYNCLTEKEWDAFYDRYPVHHSRMPSEMLTRYNTEIEQSWHGCLEFNTYDEPAVRHWSGDTRRFRVQACVDRFYWNEITSVRHFK